MTVLLFIIIFLFIAAFALFSLVFVNELILFSLLLIDYNLKALYNPTEYPRATFSLYVKNFLAEVFVILAKFYFYPLKWLNFTLNQRMDSQTAILLIHGYCRNQSDWIWMRKQLLALNCPIFCVSMIPLLASIQEITANNIPKRITEIKQKTKCKNLILIGHSMGGLVASYYSEFLDTANEVKAVISIGTPFYGTKISIVGAGENAQQMCPGSPFLNELHIPLHKTQKKYYQICSKLDNKIFPWQSALLEKTPKTQQYVLPFAAHLCMLFSKDVAKQLNVWLKELV